MAAMARREGKITEVVARKQSEFIGQTAGKCKLCIFYSDTDKPMPDIYIPLEKLNGAKDKERVLARITSGKRQIKNLKVKLCR